MNASAASLVSCDVIQAEAFREVGDCTCPEQGLREADPSSTVQPLGWESELWKEKVAP